MKEVEPIDARVNNSKKTIKEKGGEDVLL